jgi:hypothetical protein
MIPLAMIVLDELRDDVPEVPLTPWNDAIKTFFFDRPHESLGVGVRVGRVGRARGAALRPDTLLSPLARPVAEVSPETEAAPLMP